MQEAHYSMWLPIFPTYIQMVIAAMVTVTAAVVVMATEMAVAMAATTMGVAARKTTAATAMAGGYRQQSTMRGSGRN